MRPSKLKCLIFLLTTGCLIIAKQPVVHAQSPNKSKATIRFTGQKWNVVLATAKRQHKQIFVDAYAVWCAPCQELKAQTFSNAQVAGYFNKHFINVSIDVEKGQGLNLANLYDISAYPTLLFLDEDGKLIGKIEGFVDANELLKSAVTLIK